MLTVWSDTPTEKKEKEHAKNENVKKEKQKDVC